jgi:hypothetical protein
VNLNMKFLFMTLFDLLRFLIISRPNQKQIQLKKKTDPQQYSFNEKLLLNFPSIGRGDDGCWLLNAALKIQWKKAKLKRGK